MIVQELKIIYPLSLEVNHFLQVFLLELKYYGIQTLCTKVVRIVVSLVFLNNPTVAVFKAPDGPKTIPANGNVIFLILKIVLTESANSIGSHNSGIKCNISF